MLKKHRNSILAAIAASAFVFLTVCFGWFALLELSLQDMIYQRETAVDTDIKIIAIDEKTLEAIGQFEAWSREPYARLIDTLCQGENAPAVIAIDVLMPNEKGEEDLLLAEACRRAGNVVMASNLVFADRIVEADGRYYAQVMSIELVEQPFAPLDSLVRTGFVNTVLDSRDSRVRYAMLEKDGYASFASVIAQAAGAQVQPGRGMLIDYTAGAGSYETLSMIDVLEGKVPPAAFKGSIVLVGACAPGMGDAYTVPIERGSQMYGVEIHANIVQSLMEGRSLAQVSGLANAAAVALLAFAMVLLAPQLPLWGSGIMAAAVLAGQYLLCLWLDGKGIIINITGVLLAVLCSAGWAIISKYLSEALQKRKIAGAFKKYVAPQVIENAARTHDYQLKLGGEKRHIAVLFVDIRGFTPLCEALSPEQVVEILNEYFALVTEAIFCYGGTLDKFIGDAAMAVFNAPFDCEDYVYKAVRAAMDISAGSEQLAQSFEQRYGKRVSYGVGLNCGEAIVGNIGSDFRMDYTAIGDTVNTAARLEARAAAGQILVSEYVYEAVRDRVKAQQIGAMELKGKAAEIMVYSIEKELL